MANFQSRQGHRRHQLAQARRSRRTLHPLRRAMDHRTPHGGVPLAEGDLFVVPQGMEHRVRAADEATFLIVGLNITSTAEGGKPAWSFTNQGESTWQ
ncbi:MAG: cupin domain-containing protein [Thermomicrobiales bacterium]